MLIKSSNSKEKRREEKREHLSVVSTADHNPYKCVQLNGILLPEGIFLLSLIFVDVLEEFVVFG